MQIFIEILSALVRVENRIDELKREVRKLQRTERQENMATRQTLDAMNASVAANTSITAAARDALTHYAQSNADLIAQLQAAQEGGDEAEVKSAVDALVANNAALQASVPTTAAAIVANTPAA